jgi:hypothetical protein
VLRSLIGRLPLLFETRPDAPLDTTLPTVSISPFEGVPTEIASNPRVFGGQLMLIISALTSLARIMHHAACFYRSIEQMRASAPSGWIGVGPLAVQRVWY